MKMIGTHCRDEVDALLAEASEHFERLLAIEREIRLSLGLPDEENDFAQDAVWSFPKISTLNMLNNLKIAVEPQKKANAK